MVYHIFSKVKIDKYLFKYLFKSKDWLRLSLASWSVKTEGINNKRSPRNI
jgi:hypothetical protein